MRTDLSPLFRSTVGFDRFGDLIDTALRGETNTSSYPPYNIEKHGENEYRVVLAVAGFTDDDIEIITHENTLTVTGRIEETAEDEGETEGVTYLHRGIANRAFQRKFSLADHVKVTGAELNQGLLTIDLVRELPEEVKPKMIPISSAKNGQKKLSKNGKKSD